MKSPGSRNTFQFVGPWMKAYRMRIHDDPDNEDPRYNRRICKQNRLRTVTQVRPRTRQKRCTRCESVKVSDGRCQTCGASGQREAGSRPARKKEDG